MLSKSTGFLPPAPDKTAAKGTVAKTLALEGSGSLQGPLPPAQLPLATTAPGLGPA